MEQTLAEYRASLGANESPHKIDLVRCQIKGAYGMAAANAHTLWLVEQTKAEWVFQCSADDYSLPERVSTCMAAVAKHPCAAVACAMFFTQPGEKVGPQTPRSGYPTEEGYVSGGVGLSRLAYGSTIQGWNRDFFLKVGSAGDATGDVFHGYLAAIDKGYYVVPKPLHVHVQHASLSNMGCQGKMRAAEASGDKPTIHCINELNRFQLFELYFSIKLRQQQLFPLAHREDQESLVNMMLDQAVGWYVERKRLHQEGITPWKM